MSNKIKRLYADRCGRYGLIQLIILREERMHLFIYYEISMKTIMNKLLLLTCCKFEH